MPKLLCDECGWHGTEPLKAPSPFEADAVILGCPECKEVNTMQIACDEEGCWKQATCGTPTPSGYRGTCGMHRPL